jgi:hypothetical protein
MLNMKKIILTFAFLLSITYSFTAPVMPSVGTNTYYYIRFKSYGYVLQDNGANSILTCQILIPGNLSQFWKVDNGVTAGTYILTQVTVDTLPPKVTKPKLILPLRPTTNTN